MRHCLWRFFTSPMYSIKIGSHNAVMTIENIAIILHVCTVPHTGLITSISDTAGVREILWISRLVCVSYKSGFMFTLPIMVHLGLASANMQYDISSIVLSCFIIIRWASMCADTMHYRPISLYVFAYLSFRKFDIGCYFFKNICALLGRWWRHQYQNYAVFWQ